MEDENKPVESAEEKSDLGMTGPATQADTKPRRTASPKAAMLLGALIIVVCIVGYFTISTLRGSQTPSTVFSEAELEKTVNVSKLATSKCVYRGIAEKRAEDGDVLYHVYYESTVEASIDMSDISFEIDEDKKTVTPILPQPSIDTPVLDTSSIEFFERDASGDMKDAITLCKQDALEKVKSNTAITNRASQNLRSTVEALTKPILEREGYTLSWNIQSEKEASDAV